MVILVEYGDLKQEIKKKATKFLFDLRGRVLGQVQRSPT